jgi:hypothetical protein
MDHHDICDIEVNGHLFRLYHRGSLLHLLVRNLLMHLAILKEYASDVCICITKQSFYFCDGVQSCTVCLMMVLKEEKCSLESSLID